LFLASLAVCAVIRIAPYAAPIRAADIAQATQAVAFTDRTGLPLGTILSRDQNHTAFVRLSDVSPSFVHAIVAAEDGRYYERGPVDMLALARAAYQSIRDRAIVSGASTIPMQLARMVKGLPSTPWGKVEQIWFAWRLAAGMDRDEILEAYVNRLPMGGNVYGVEAAARTYFGVPARGLDLAQATLLAAIPNDPTGLDPYSHLDGLRVRQQYVLDRMVADGYIGRVEAERARTEEVDLADRHEGIVAAPHLLFWLAGQMASGTAQVRTTIDRPLQGFVEEQIRQVLRDLASRNVVDAAALVIDNRTGQVLAYAGSPDYFDRSIGGSNDGVQALRQPGSALKPFLYEYALESRAVQPNTILADVPVHYALPGDLVYSPSDYSDTFAGPVRVRIALADSLNVPAVKVLERVGVGAFLDRLHELGFDHLDKAADYYGLGLTLGGGEVSLWELARAYVTLARNGDPIPLTAVMPSGSAPAVQPDAIGSASSWELVTDILSDAHARARSFGVVSALRLPFPTAVKTGTSSDFRDTWTVGYTPDYTVAVWVGNFDGGPMRHVSGVAGAAPLWNRIMLHLYESREPVPFPPPDGLVLMPICATTGLRPGPDCSTVVSEYLFPEDIAHYESDRPPPDLPHDYDQWLASQPAAETGSTLRIVRPLDGSYFIITRGGDELTPGPLQRLGFEAAGTRQQVRWSLNGRPIGASVPGDRLFWTLAPGSYDLVATSGAMRDGVRFTVAAAQPSGLRRGFAIGGHSH
jgi:penicillin-binding protein 1C